MINSENRLHTLMSGSHNLALVQKLCTRAIILDGGRIAFDGPVGEALRQYRTKFE